ncbi:MAG TPA: molybdopterin oxidoreductase family protein [Bryobacteraceae bacterium]|nr:molybdopterin oxidoreductase family protein [Bryobacteraceae bacterium]
MAKPPQSIEELTRLYGPHLNYAPPGGWGRTGQRPVDKLVKTHCSFCGMQCGLQLKVRDNKVVGFEPWEEFPFNRGMLCPKGVKRYLQGEHPDRLLQSLLRTDSGFQPISYEEALDFAARRISEIKQKYGPDAVAIYGGASMITEKTYVLGKFARVAVGTRNIDYNGRLCMVSAGTAYKLAFGIDRATNPWTDLERAKVVLIAGSNTAECAPITTHYLWQCREAGGRLIVVDPRMTPITRKADLFLPVRPGTDLALFLGMLHVIVRDGLAKDEYIARHTSGWEAVRDSVRDWTPERAASVTGVPPENIVKAARWIGETDRAMGVHARGIEHQSKGVENCLAMVNLFLATGNFGREGAGCMMITGQGNGQGGREHGQKADQLPGARSITDPEARRHVAAVWGIDEKELPGPGLTAVEIMEAIHRGEIKALFSMCFNPLVSLPDSHYTREALSKLEFFGVIDFFMSETAHHADLIFAGSLHEEDEGVICSAEGRVQKINKAVDPPGQAKSDALILCDLARKLNKGKYFEFASTKEIFEELRRASQGGVADYYGITWERVEQELGVFWPCPTLDHPGTRRLFENGRFYHPDGKARFLTTDWRPSGDPVDAEYPLYLTTGRVVSHYLSGTQTRRIGPLVDQAPEPKVEMHPRLAARYGIDDGDWVRVITRRSDVVAQAMVVKTIRPDTVFIPYHWPGPRSANRLTHRTLDPRSKIPEFKVSACRIEKASPPADLQEIRRQETGWTGAPATTQRGPEEALVTPDQARREPGGG